MGQLMKIRIDAVKRGLLACCLVLPGPQLHHYVFFNLARERIADRVFIETPAFEGAQLKYTWRELEPEKDRYDFSAIRKDLAFLRSHHKKLFIQLQDVSFDTARINVPGYLVPTGVVSTQGGWVAARWNPLVQQRFAKLLLELGREFDGQIEGINLPETALDLSEADIQRSGFTAEAYRDAVITNMKALKRAFRKSVALQYANFMPGEWLPGEDHGYLRTVYAAAESLGVAVGGPDLLPHRNGQLNHSYRFIPSATATRNGIAVQEGNYDNITVRELIDFAQNKLGVTYIFWFPEEPYFSRDVVPMLQH